MMAKTPAQRGDLGRRRKASSQKSAASKRRRADDQKAAAARKEHQTPARNGVRSKVKVTED
jgi:hypothetical protein